MQPSRILPGVTAVAVTLVIASASLPARADIPPGPPPPPRDPNVTAPDPPKRPAANESGRGCSAPGQVCAALALVVAAVVAHRAASRQRERASA